LSISKEKVWMKHYAEDVANKPMPKCTAYNYVKWANQDRLDQTAIHYYGKNISYKEFFYNIDACANAFTALGVKAGDNVSFLTVGFPETIAAVYALNKIGATANTIDPRMDVESIRRMIKESDSKILISVDIAYPKVVPILDDIAQDYVITMSAARSLPFLKKMVMTLKTKTEWPYSDKVIKWDAFLEKGKGHNAVEAPYIGDAVVAIAYTGGTTGFPKGVMLTNDSMNATAFNFKYAGLKVSPGDKFLGIIPVFTSYGMVCGMHMPLCLQLELIPIPKFEPPKFGKLIKQFRPNHMISTPAFYETMMNSREVRNMDLSFVITMGSGGDTMNEGLEGKLAAFMKKHNIRYPLAQGYGMSEMSAAASFCVNDIYKPGSVGIPSVTTTISVFDTDSGEELGYGQLGEICMTGPSMMKGYYKRKEETDHVMRMHDDGQIWVHSGDIGYMDEDGFLYIIGRVKRMITRFDGHKVFPVTIESMISEHEEVRNCSTIGVDDLDHGQGQYPLVLVELYDGADNFELCKKLYLEANKRMEERGRPVAVLPVASIPLTGSGKNDYRALEEEFKGFDYVAWQKQI